MNPGPGSERRLVDPATAPEYELGRSGALLEQVGRMLVSPFRLVALLALMATGVAALAAGPVLVVRHLMSWPPPPLGVPFPGVPPRAPGDHASGRIPAVHHLTAGVPLPQSGDHFHLYLGLLVTLVPCLVWGSTWATGGRGRAAGAVLALPGVLTVAAAVFYQGDTPGGNHGVVLLAPFLIVLGVFSARWAASEQRRLVGRWTGRPIPDPYRPLPAAEPGRGWARARAATVGQVTDPALWRDAAWSLVGGTVALAGLALLVLSPWLLDQLGPNGEFAKPVVLYGLALMMSPVLVLWGAPVVLGLHARAARVMTGPSRQRELTARVRHLSETRAETIDHSAAELRRIERDLHDGAQARLVALGMALNAAEQLFDTDPAAARALLTEAKGASAKALTELRDLVRGIHPPVLADRGLVHAVQALVLDLPLSVQVNGALDPRPPAAVESAAYFAVSELMANAVKHAEARRGWIEIGHTDGMLRIVVTDDGRGDADPARGSGLRGIERRLAAFDGVLAVSSPVGGPTIASLEIPCASPSPKTSSSSATA